MQCLCACAFATWDHAVSTLSIIVDYLFIDGENKRFVQMHNLQLFSKCNGTCAMCARYKKKDIASHAQGTRASAEAKERG